MEKTCQGEIMYEFVKHNPPVYVNVPQLIFLVLVIIGGAMKLADFYDIFRVI